jgi:hypothetical protein
MRKYNVNENFFDELNEKSVYWLGFLYADGYVRLKDGKSGEVKLKLDADFRNYPYIDTMCFLSKDKDSLSNLSDKKCYILHSL